MNSEFLESATQAARAIIQRNLTPRGMAASVDGYPQVWARDSVITLLGASIGCSETVMQCYRTSLDQLAKNQDRFGQIPYSVWVQDGRREYRSSDANAWFVIGVAHFVALTQDLAWLQERVDVVVRALDWYEAQDLSHSGLMEAGECSDWADLLSHRGQVLFPNVLTARALHAGAQLLESVRPDEAERFRNRAAVVQAAIQKTFWVQSPGTFSDETHGQIHTLMSAHLRRRPYFLPWVGLYEYGERFDTTANLLAVVTGLATPEQGNEILNYIRQTGLNRPYPVQVLHPAIQPGESDWRDYYKMFNCNLPHQYHNGGIWPWVGGVYVAALVKMKRLTEARQELVRLAESLQLGETEWECNEWLHGQSGQPMGVKSQAWSAGMFLYARHAVETGELGGLSE